MYELQERLLAATEHQIKQLMAMEQQQTWTQNDHYLVSSKQCFEERLVKQLYGTGSNARMQSALDCLRTAGIALGLTAEDLEVAMASKKRKAAEQEGGLLDMIAGTLAYYKVGGCCCIVSYQPTLGCWGCLWHRVGVKSSATGELWL
jgi:hypothetical protein